MLMCMVTASDVVTSETTLSLTQLREEFATDGGYLSACTLGLPLTCTRRALTADLERSTAGHPDVAGYAAAVESSRYSFARLVRISPEQVAIGSQTSVLAALIASGVPDGGEVLVAEQDFSSLLLPFTHVGRGIRVRQVPLGMLADEVNETTSLVAFSLVQSCSGEVADADAVIEAAQRFGARTFCDATQAVGWLAVDAGRYDALVCHAYKWLCSPRGVAFLALSDRFCAELTPQFAGWYSGEDPWSSCYGIEITPARSARRFDVSPAWQAFLGAAPALDAFASADADAIFQYTTDLAARFRIGMGIPEPIRASAMVSWSDETGQDLRRLATGGMTASGRAGRSRVAFHVFNDAEDVDRAVSALRSRS